MANSLAFSPLPLSLPNSRMSVDFATFTTSQPETPQLPRQHTIPRRPVPKSDQLQQISEEPPITRRSPAREHPRRRWAIFPSTPEHPNPPALSNVTELSRATSNASVASTASGYSTTASSLFSDAQLTSTRKTANSSQSSLGQTLKKGNIEKEPATLASMPSYLLEHILSYALCLPLNVSIGPPSSDKQHKQYRYRRAGVDYIDVQLIRKHPIFLVSRHVRHTALNALHDRCTFIIDLHSIYHSSAPSTVHDSFKKHKHFWVDNRPPRMVRDTLRTLSRLNIRVPVASYEDGGNSAGKGGVANPGEQEGSNQRIRSLKKEKEDAARIERHLEVILSLIWADKDSEEETRGRSPSVDRRGSLRKRNKSRFRSKSRERSSRNQELSRPAFRGVSRPGGHENSEKRQPLRRLEVVLIKRSPHVTVLPETLQLIKLLRTSKVQGFTKYFLELEEQKTLFAQKYGKRWQGIEPDGPRLLSDLQSLSVAFKPIEPFLSSPEIRSHRVTTMGKLPRLDTNVPKSPVALERSKSTSAHSSSPSSMGLLRNPLNWGKKRLKRKDSFQLEDGPEETGAAREPPSIDELKKIAEDVRNGLY